jgi:hypothetical protein
MSSPSTARDEFMTARSEAFAYLIERLQERYNESLRADETLVPAMGIEEAPFEDVVEVAEMLRGLYDGLETDEDNAHGFDVADEGEEDINESESPEDEELYDGDYAVLDDPELFFGPMFEKALALYYYPVLMAHLRKLEASDALMRPYDPSVSFENKPLAEAPRLQGLISAYKEMMEYATALAIDLLDATYDMEVLKEDFKLSPRSETYQYYKRLGQETIENQIDKMLGIVQDDIGIERERVAFFESMIKRTPPAIVPKTPKPPKA